MESAIGVLSVIAGWELGKWIYRAVKQWWIKKWSI